MSKDKNLLIQNKSSKISTAYELFRQKVVKKAKKSTSLFKGHLFSFISVNTFLIFLNIITPGNYPWFLYPLGSMAILLSLHYTSKNDRMRQKHDIEKYPVLSDKAFKLLKKLFRKRRFTKISTIFTVSVSAFLFMVNIITGTGYFWASIPTAALATISGTVWFLNRADTKELLKTFRLLAEENRSLLSGSLDISNTRYNTRDYPSLIEAYSLKDAIQTQLDQIGAIEDPLLDTIPELVNNYITQIKKLLEKNEEFTGILQSNPYKKLLIEREGISDKMNTAENDQLRAQYKTSLLELDNQLTASKKITNEIELFSLKIGSALNSIRMLHLDLANLNVEKMSHNEMMKVLEKESKKLSERLKDLQFGYSELEKEMM